MPRAAKAGWSLKVGWEQISVLSRPALCRVFSCALFLMGLGIMAGERLLCGKMIPTSVEFPVSQETPQILLEYTKGAARGRQKVCGLEKLEASKGQGLETGPQFQ